MKTIHITETEHSNLNPRLKFFLKEFDSLGVQFKFKLADRLKERNLTVRECAKFTGLRIATISAMMNGTKSSINLHHILVIMIGLRITKIEDIVEIHIPDSLKEHYEAESKDWILKGEVSDELEHLKYFWEGAYDKLIPNSIAFENNTEKKED